MSGMIKKVATSTPAAAPNAEPVVDPNGVVDNAWYWDEGIPGTGDRPEWLKGKYGKVVDQAKAYLEAEKAMGANGAAVPDDYDWGSYSDLFDVENPAMAELKNKAKELKLSQEAFNILVDPFAKYHKSLIPDTDAEIAKLGPHADMKINTVNTWASNLLSDKSLATLGQISQTADVIEMVDEIRQLHSQTLSKVPTQMQATVGRPDVLTPEQVQQKIVDNYQRYQADASYRQQLNAEMKQACGED